MRYPDDYELPIPEPITLPELLFELEREVLAVASTDGRYLAAWKNLTPASAFSFLFRHRGDIRERCERDEHLFQAYAEAAPVFLQDMCRVATLVEAALDGKPYEGPVLSTSASKQHDSEVPGARKRLATQWSADIRASYDRMLSFAVNAGTTESVTTAGTTTWTAETSRFIEEIRASEFADRTVFHLRDTQLPSPLRTNFWRNHLAIKVSDEWMAEYSTYVTHDAPSLAVTQRHYHKPTLVLELASGTIRLDAMRMSSHLREFSTELPILFVSTDTCALALHRFNSLVDGLTIEDYAGRPDSHHLLPHRDKIVRLPNGSTVVAEERFSMFEEGWGTERSLTSDPDELEEIPF